MIKRPSASGYIKRWAVEFKFQTKIFRAKESNGRERIGREMVMLCFVLDLRSLPPPLLADLKQVLLIPSSITIILKAKMIDRLTALLNLFFIRQLLLQLANFYAISPSFPQSNSLSDRIGLCYLFNNRISSSDEVPESWFYNSQI